MTDFKPYIGRKRRSGTGCVSEINDHLFEGRYSPKWPDGKKHSRNVYAHTREECEEKLKVLIIDMKTELAELKRQKAEGTLPVQEVKKYKNKSEENEFAVFCENFLSSYDYLMPFIDKAVIAHGVWTCVSVVYGDTTVLAVMDHYQYPRYLAIT